MSEASKIIGTWQEPEHLIGENLQKLVGLAVSNIEVYGEVLDLHIEFGNRFVLSIVCDQSEGDNFSLGF